MNKKYLIIGGAGVALVALYLLSRKKTASMSEKIESATSEAANSLADLYSGNVAAPNTSNYSQVDMDYNDAVRRYVEKYRQQPDRSWTTEEIEVRIKSYDEIAEYIQKYHTLEAEFDEGNVEKTDKELGRMTVTDLQDLVLKLELQNKRTRWNQRKAEIGQLVDEYIAGNTDCGTWAGDAKKFPLETMKQLHALSKNEKIYADSYFAMKGGIDTGATWLKYTKSPFRATRIADSIAFGNNDSFVRDRAWRNVSKDPDRNNIVAWIRDEFLDGFSNLSGRLNEYGEII